jgi:mannose-6-phosphate isomerase-like protein (cupin superfamily)
VAAVTALACAAAASFAAAAEPAPKGSAGKAGAGPAASPLGVVQSFEDVAVEKFSWGWIRWLMSSKIDPEAQMTFGIVHVEPAERNPLHVHPNCEEQIYVLSGSCEHRVGQRIVVLKAGDMLRIPAGVPHMARTFEKEPLRAVIVYSSGTRQFVAVEEEETR